ncbi:hypothetical protein [Tessaracoccus oleiagri]|uniref:Uncharacterized protein n=1 Tax=Tessaracoccus oleiagri TaxID=686624 RepID=A0A1G9IJE6_9ACTN|nr:hypothetical protein [Tessaracoccus oleiagri]SDL25186.1 hypothetical protein SAMN04488242_0971 [Tessaracoccus oleiagri]
MTGTSKVLSAVALVVLLLMSLAGSLFAAGYAFTDLPLWLPILGSLLWLAIAVGLTFVVLRFPEVAVQVMLAVTAVVALLIVLDGTLGIFRRDELGPVATVLLLAVFVPLAFLGLRRPVLAALMLATLALVQLLGAGLIRSGVGDGAPFVALLRGSSGIVVLPTLLAAALFLVAGLLAHDSWRLHPTHGARMAH